MMISLSQAIQKKNQRNLLSQHTMDNASEIPWALLSQCLSGQTIKGLVAQTRHSKHVEICG